MSIPPFPSQDLAKLVLGYLADEQLMTAYDEFLQASPYLDALRNEYDRLFMTSLKNILAEYRAVKIYVETCKPLGLRKRLSQCTNMLEIVKFLVCNIDINKIQEYCSDKSSIIKQNTGNSSKRNLCDECNASNCQCKSMTNAQGSASQSTNQIDATSVENSVQTTLLSDLPGHVAVRKRHVKLLEKDSKSSTSLSNCEQSDNDATSIHCEESSPIKSNQDKSISPLKTNTTESIQKIEEFNDILKKVSDKNKEEKSRCVNNSEAANIECRQSMDTFQDFASGIRDNPNASVPDSSTSENIQIHASRDTADITNAIDVPKTKKKAVKNTNPTLACQTNKETLKFVNICPNPVGLLKSIPDEHKIKILSDIKVEKDKVGCRSIKMPAVLKNATSTPLAQMQTIHINGTPVYKHNYISTFKYTEDEIMAMPTIIIVPTSATTQTKQSLPTNSQNSNNMETHTVTSSAQSLEPLIIDVPANNSVTNNLQSVELGNPSNIGNNNNLVTTVENIKNASVPKDSIVTCANKTNTPQLLPPVRKSSSTPRRTSHVRVLDFTTPRRILHETLNENLPEQNSNNPVEVVLSESQDVVYTTANSSKSVVTIEENHNNDKLINSPNIDGPTKENNSTINPVPKKKPSWDADLRAIAIANERDPLMSIPTPRPKPKRKSKKKKPPDDNQAEYICSQLKVECKKGDRKKSSPSKTRKKISKSAEETANIVSEETGNIVEGTLAVPVKPTINIISGQDWGMTSNQINIKNENIKNEVDTPEIERLSLQNEIGAKLNISDLLETPYKQALYDIQMETPRFLGSDLPHDPMASDIKITNIPTPRFLATPKPTPSSYSSRPTDYSSGGSYYKPDDLDYIPAPEDLGCPVTSSIENINPADSDQKVNEINKKDKLSCVKSRPVRQCTKNVSYVSSPYANNKTKDVDKIDNCSFCSDTISIDTSSESKSDRDGRNINITKISKPKAQVKSTSKKRISSSKVIKSPLKKEKVKPFMKIKPRRPTPPRNQSKCKRKTHEILNTTSSKLLNRKRTSSKERQLNVTPLIAAVPTKSRRKSSTPRKLHCTKTFHSESSGHDSPEIISKDKSSINQNPNIATQDSDTEQLALRWSDDGSQDAKTKEQTNPTSFTNETDDILKIKEYIETSVSNKLPGNENDRSLHVHLIKRGFDAETAKIIERDLLDSPNTNMVESNTVRSDAVEGNTVEGNTVKGNTVEGNTVEGNTVEGNTVEGNTVESNTVDCNGVDSTSIKPTEEIENKNDEAEKTLESNLNASNNLLIDQADDDIEDFEFTVHQCNDETDNYVTFNYDDTKYFEQKPAVQLKDKYCMEVCINDVDIRLFATPFIVSFEEKPADTENLSYSFRETEIAVSSISNIDRLYTPLKESIKAQCYEIFDSTLTSLDTPLKANSPKRKDPDMTVTEIVLEVEKVEIRQTISQVKDKESRKRKRIQSGNTSDESLSDNKKTRPETQYVLNSANIQNIDIESVLSKLHGP